MSYPWANNPQPLTPLMDEGLKRKFAMMLANMPDKAFSCACEIFPENVGLALQAANQWPRDPIVTEILAIASIKRPPVPTKEEAALKALAIADATVNGSDKPMHDAKDRIAALKLFAEIMGYIDKSLLKQETNIYDAKVLVVPQFRTEADFEAAAIKQQTNLILSARKNAPKS